MFDLERAIRQWKAPFTQRHIYSGQDISELEMHLRDVIADERLWGASDEQAFQSAVRRVGSERTLRPDYELSWSEATPIKRYARSVWNERIILDGTAKRSAYAFVRLFSIVYGLFSVLYFLPLAYQVFMLWAFPPEVPIYFMWYRWVLICCAALSGWISLTPFRIWEGSIWDWAKGAYAVFTLALLSHYIISVEPSHRLDVIYTSIEIIALSIGPLVWLFHALSPKDDVYPSLSAVTAP